MSGTLHDANPAASLHASTHLLELLALVHRVLGAENEKHIESRRKVKKDLLTALAVVEERVADKNHGLGLGVAGGERGGGARAHAASADVGGVAFVLGHGLVACDTVLEV